MQHRRTIPGSFNNSNGSDTESCFNTDDEQWDTDTDTDSTDIDTDVNRGNNIEEGNEADQA